MKLFSKHKDMNKISQLYEDRANLSKVAYEALRTEDIKGDLRIFRVRIFSNYELPASYGVYQNYHQPDKYFGIIKRWRQDTDLNKLRNPIERLKHPEHLKPTIENYSFELEIGFIQSVLDELKVIKLPVFIGDYSPRGLDRINYEIELGSLFSTSRFYWSEKCPSEWEPLKKFIQKIVQLLDKELTNQSINQQEKLPNNAN
ncbi:MAG: hypothetical protein GY797_22285 [Deltaproteobacteria bacterium]|nr:hypothetical protein [Deltaproteobacteria bacterium]